MRPRWMIWTLWGGTLWGSTAFVTSIFFRPTAREVFLPGKTTHGHHQIELSCNACHTAFGGVSPDACNRCHANDLAAARDSHPRSKFTDPRNAGLLQTIDAMNCVTCHREHEPHATHAMGVTQPTDYCFHCHADIGEDRPSHRGMPFTTCANAGCHNYHDNTALYEPFLAARINEPSVKPEPRRPARSPVAAPTELLANPLPDGPPDIVHDWAASTHALAGVDCRACHTDGGASAIWIPKPGLDSCVRCHEGPAAGFKAGLHGMRLAENLPPMTPALARQPMRPEAAHRELSCVSCHGPHDVDTRRAAVDSCLECHSDDHSRAYTGSPHHALWLAEIDGRAPAGSGVSCATCHLPREVHRVDGSEVVRVQHNQNANLRPNEKMIRTVCNDCHGVPFALEALADRGLVERNFRGPPASRHETIELILRRSAANARH